MSVPLYQAKAELFRTLGHPVHIRVLELLQDGPKPVRDLLAVIEVEASNLSQQLAVLRRAGMVTSIHRDGPLVMYALSTPDVADLLAAGRRILGAVLTDRDGLLGELRATERGQVSGAIPVAPRAASSSLLPEPGRLGRRVHRSPRRDLAGRAHRGQWWRCRWPWRSASPPGLGRPGRIRSTAVDRRRGGRCLRRLQPAGLQAAGAMTVVLVPVVQQFGSHRRAHGRGDGRPRCLIALAPGPPGPVRPLPAHPRLLRGSPPASPWSSHCNRYPTASASATRTGERSGPSPSTRSPVSSYNPTAGRRSRVALAVAALMLLGARVATRPAVLPARRRGCPPTLDRLIPVDLARIGALPQGLPRALAQLPRPRRAGACCSPSALAVAALAALGEPALRHRRRWHDRRPAA